MTKLAAALQPRWRRRLSALVLVLVVWFATGFAAAHVATRARPAAIEPLSNWQGHRVEPVQATAEDGVVCRGWLVAPPGADACVVLAAGIGGHRLGMLARSEFWLRRGTATLLVDLRGTGETEASRLSMGYHEALDLAAWHALARTRGFRRIGVHGVSLGAAAAIYTAVRPAVAPAWAFAVLEASYVDIRSALYARLPWLPAIALWPMVASAEWLLAVDADDLSPERAIRQLAAPTLLVVGDRDHKVGPDANARLRAASGAAIVREHVVSGAAHVDLWSRDAAGIAAAIEDLLRAR
jgi:pimeloyl-ACP methyl ester carboxylesterase